MCSVCFPSIQQSFLFPDIPLLKGNNRPMSPFLENCRIVVLGFLGKNHMWYCTCLLFLPPSPFLICSSYFPPQSSFNWRLSLPPPAEEMRREVIFANAVSQIGHGYTVSSAATFSMGNHQLLGFLKLGPGGSATCFFFSSGLQLSLA